MINILAISNYRSLRDLRLSLGKINVIEGPNGSGKTNIYRALRLLVDAAEGRLVQSLAKEGGLSSVLWAIVNEKNGLDFGSLRPRLCGGEGLGMRGLSTRKIR